RGIFCRESVDAMSNFQNVTFETPRAPDDAVIESARKTLVTAGVDPAMEVFLTPVFGGQAIQCQLSALDRNAEVQAILAEKGCLVSGFRFVITKQAALVIARQEGSLRDRVTLDLTGMNQGQPHSLQRDQILRLAASAKSNFREMMARDQFAALGRGHAEFYEQREAQLAKMEATVERVSLQFGANAAKQRADLDKEFAERTQRADKELSAQKAQLAAQLEARNAALNEREEALNQRLAQVDDRAAMHVRRSRREEM